MSYIPGMKTTRAEFLTALVAQLNAGEITKAQGRKAIRAFDAAVKREAKGVRRVAFTVEQVRAAGVAKG